ncbi:MAG: hypothetical protein IJI37_07955 [Opitutales bacterium]|nr:hypothetical protein [Opitutales bacterium]
MTIVKNCVRLERGMSVQVASVVNPILCNGGEAAREAFMRVYGIDLKKAGALSSGYLNAEKLN